MDVGRNSWLTRIPYGFCKVAGDATGGETSSMFNTIVFTQLIVLDFKLGDNFIFFFFTFLKHPRLPPFIWTDTRT